MRVGNVAAIGSDAIQNSGPQIQSLTALVAIAVAVLVPGYDTRYC
jgi:hypothetical protein